MNNNETTLSFTHLGSQVRTRFVTAESGLKSEVIELSTPERLKAYNESTLALVPEKQSFGRRWQT